MKIKTSALTGVALDWAVAKCEMDCDPEYFNDSVWITTGGFFAGVQRTVYAPSTNWAQGGPIIEREHIGLDYDDGLWSACHPLIRPKKKWWRDGPTPLIAAMRCYVASKLGDEVNLPEELLA